MRTIDADALKAEFKVPTDWLDSRQVFTHVTGIWTTIDRAPTIESEQKIGHWIICSDGYYPYCSECKHEPKSGIMTKYCPNCGAYMKGENNENQNS